MTLTLATQIDIDERGVARIPGTRLKVSHLAVERVSLGMTPEEIQAAHDHISLAQVYAALTYYQEHKAEIDAQVEAEKQLAEEILREASDPVFRARLVALKTNP